MNIVSVTNRREKLLNSVRDKRVIRHMALKSLNNAEIPGSSNRSRSRARIERAREVPCQPYNSEIITTNIIIGRRR